MVATHRLEIALTEEQLKRLVELAKWGTLSEVVGKFIDREFEAYRLERNLEGIQRMATLNLPVREDALDLERDTAGPILNPLPPEDEYGSN